MNIKKLVSWHSLEGWQGNIVAYQNINDGKILTVKEYREMLEREIIDFWNSLDEYQKMEYNGFNHFREYHLNSPDPDFIPLVEFVSDEV